MLDNGDPWIVEDFQAAALEDLFAGAPELWDIVPEGNAKSTLMGGVALYHCDYTPDANVLMAASSRDQCGILLGQASGFVRRSPGMAKRFRVYEGYRRIQSLRLGGRIQVFAADDRTGDGVIPSLCLVDELHRHRDLRLYRTWRGKLGKRGAQMVVISTSGEPGSEFEDTIQRVRSNGKATPTDDGHERIVDGDLVLHRWAVPDDGDVEDMEQVKRANPLRSITIDALATKRASPTMTLPHWRRFVCNQPDRGEHAAISSQEWARAATDRRPEPGETIFGVGIDLGWTWDTTAIVPLWSPEPGLRVLLDPTIIVPPRDGTSTPPSEIHRALRDVHDQHPFEVVAMDRQAGGEQMAEWIETELGCRVIGYSNGNAEMAQCAGRFYEGLRTEPEPTLQHTGHEELTRHVMNARARVLPRGDPVFDRPTSSRSKGSQDRRVIDGLSAAQIIHDAAVSDDAPKPVVNLDDYRIRRV